MKAQTIDYIISWLCRGNQEAAHFVGYCRWEEREDWHRVVIEPAAVFEPNKLEEAPVFPLPRLNDIPVLYGEPIIESHDNVILLKADLVASTFFVLSRYEELYTKERDKHQRFTAKQSWMYKEQMLSRPIADEYSALLRQLLQSAGVQTADTPNRIAHVTFTHDADILTAHRRFRGIVGSLLRGDKTIDIIRSLRDINADPAYQFPFLFHLNQEIREAETIVFVKSVTKSKHKEDHPIYSVKSRDTKALFRLAEENNVSIGLHSSYAASVHLEKMVTELRQLEFSLGKSVILHRHHYLLVPEAETPFCFSHIGINHDYSMGFADHVGFRLGTSHTVRRIKPLSQEITADILHPLLLMDVTLSEPQYMNLSYAQAKDLCQQLFENVALHHGEAVVLWHNTSIGHSYHTSLYKDVVEQLKRLAQ